MIRIAGGLHGPRIVTFGDTPALSPQVTASVLRRFRAATSPNGSPQTASRSPRSPRVFPRTTNEMLEDVDTGSNAANSLQELQSMVMEVAKVSSAVITPVTSLAPAILTALEEATAAPFLFFRWLSPCLVEVS